MGILWGRTLIGLFHSNICSEPTVESQCTPCRISHDPTPTCFSDLISSFTTFSTSLSQTGLFTTCHQAHSSSSLPFLVFLTSTARISPFYQNSHHFCSMSPSPPSHICPHTPYALMPIPAGRALSCPFRLLRSMLHSACTGMSLDTSISSSSLSEPSKQGPELQSQEAQCSADTNFLTSCS